MKMSAALQECFFLSIDLDFLPHALHNRVECEVLDTEIKQHITTQIRSTAHSSSQSPINDYL